MPYFADRAERNPMPADIAVIVGAGSGLSAALARACAKRAMTVVLAARDIGKLSDLAGETDARLRLEEVPDRPVSDSELFVLA